MRSFIITLLLLLAMLCGIFCNHLYINNVASEMLERLDKLPDITSEECVRSCRELLEYWNQQLSLAELSASYTLVDKVSEQATLLVACAECGDRYGFRSASELLRDAIGDMRRLEELSLGNIF